MLRQLQSLEVSERIQALTAIHSRVQWTTEPLSAEEKTRLATAVQAALSDPEVKVWSEALEVFVYLEAWVQGDLGELLLQRAAAAPSHWTWSQCVEILGRRLKRDPLTRAVLLQALNNPEETIRKTAVAALGQSLPQQTSQPAVLEDLLKPDWDRPTDAPAPSDEPALQAESSGVDPSLSLEQSEETNESEISISLLERLSDASPDVVLQALEFVPRLPISLTTAQPLVLAAVKKPASSLPETPGSPLQLLNRDPDASVAILVLLLEHPDKSVALAAARLLGTFGVKAHAALPALEHAHANYRAAPQESLDRIRLASHTLWFVWLALLPFLVAPWILRRFQDGPSRRQFRIGLLIVIFGMPLGFATEQAVSDAVRLLLTHAGPYRLDETLAALEHLRLQGLLLLVALGVISFSLTPACLVALLPAVGYATLAILELANIPVHQELGPLTDWDHRWAWAALAIGLGFGLSLWSGAKKMEKAFQVEKNETAQARARLAKRAGMVLCGLSCLYVLFSSLRWM